jgi:hypothetical protein
LKKGKKTMSQAQPSYVVKDCPSPPPYDSHDFILSSDKVLQPQIQPQPQSQSQQKLMVDNHPRCITLHELQVKYKDQHPIFSCDEYQRLQSMVNVNRRTLMDNHQQNFATMTTIYAAKKHQKLIQYLNTIQELQLQLMTNYRLSIEKLSMEAEILYLQCQVLHQHCKTLLQLRRVQVQNNNELLLSKCAELDIKITIPSYSFREKEIGVIVSGVEYKIEQLKEWLMTNDFKASLCLHPEVCDCRWKCFSFQDKPLSLQSGVQHQFQQLLSPPLSSSSKPGLLFTFVDNSNLLHSIPSHPDPNKVYRIQIEKLCHLWDRWYSSKRSCYRFVVDMNQQDDQTIEAEWRSMGFFTEFPISHYKDQLIDDVLITELQSVLLTPLTRYYHPHGGTSLGYGESESRLGLSSRSDQSAKSEYHMKDEEPTILLATGNCNISQGNGQINFPMMLRTALEKKWNLHIWAWKSSLHPVYLQLAHEFPNQCKICYLDNVQDFILYIE